MTYLLFGGRKALLCLLVGDTSRAPWITLEQQGEHDRSAILQDGETREVEVEPAAG